jgi:ADP-ribose pyrophosphatase YjhB (NUDIX family)
VRYFVREKWLDWAIRIQSVAQSGLTYSRDKYDLERFHQLRELAAEIMCDYTGIPEERVVELFCSENGYQTPKIDVRAAVVEEGRILLVKEQIDGKWSLPGGWAEVNLSLSENVVKEVREEAGFTVEAESIVAVLDAKRKNPVQFPYGIYKIIMSCRRTGGAFVPNIETTESAFFLPEELPELSLGRTTGEQIELCIRAAGDPNFVPVFD